MGRIVGIIAEDTTLIVIGLPIVADADPIDNYIRSADGGGAGKHGITLADGDGNRTHVPDLLNDDI